MFLRKNKNILIVGVTIGCGLLAWLLYYVFFTFHITSIQPGLSKVASITPYITVDFNRVLAEDENIKIDSDPAIIDSVVVEEKRLVLYLQTMDVGKAYEITLPTISSTDGKYITGEKISFTARNIDFDRLPQEHQEYILNKQDNEPNPIKDDPIFNYVPYGTLDYSIDALVDENNKVLIQVSLLLTAADLRSNRAAAEAKYKNEADAYLRSLGVNLDDYVITYKIVEPTL